ncbi:MAG: hypothetical protein K0Q97_2046 [Bacillota bacterium]|jgi:3D (Asp-Asp-Asp) domain-containing protein|nr:hypothetical protein [Bacillota bacterium]
MKRKKIYPFFIVTILIMSFIVTYDINERNSKNFAYADTSGEVSKAYVEPVDPGPIKEIKYDVVQEGLDYETKIVHNENEFEGYEQVVQAGSAGMKKLVYQELYEDGKLISKDLAEEIVYKVPVDKIVEVGTKQMVVTTSRGGFRYSQEMDFVASAYDLSFASTGKNPGDAGYGITASGTKAQPGTVAVDPSVIPLGTKLYIASTDGSPDYGFATALDTGGAIKGNRIDLFMEDGVKANNFGIRHVKIYILD